MAEPVRLPGFFFAPSVVRGWFVIVVGCIVLSLCVGVDAQGILKRQNEEMLGRVGEILSVARTAVAFALVGGLLWTIAMWATGRPAIKPVVSTLVALVLLFGLHSLVGFFTPEVPAGIQHVPEDTLRGL